MRDALTHRRVSDVMLVNVVVGTVGIWHGLTWPLFILGTAAVVLGLVLVCVSPLWRPSEGLVATVVFVGVPAVVVAWAIGEPHPMCPDMPGAPCPEPLVFTLVEDVFPIAGVVATTLIAGVLWFRGYRRCPPRPVAYASDEETSSSAVRISAGRSRSSAARMSDS